MRRLVLIAIAATGCGGSGIALPFDGEPPDFAGVEVDFSAPDLSGQSNDDLSAAVDGGVDQSQPDLAAPLDLSTPAKTLNFQTAPTYTVPNTPVAVARGDFDGDGNMDIAVVSTAAGSASVLLNKGNGTFKPAVSYAAGTSPAAIAAGDLNGDGRADLVVGTSLGISVLVNNGNGTFKAPVDYNSSSATGNDRVLLIDVNGDTKLDAVYHGTCGQYSVRLGGGDGTLNAGGGSYSPVPPNNGTNMCLPGLSVGDINKDGKLDIVGLDQWTQYAGNPVLTFFMTLTGNGDGTFVDSGPGGSVPSLSTNASLTPTMADLDGDGVNDVALLTPGSSLTIMHGNGAGGFTAGTSMSFPFSQTLYPGPWVITDDVNGDSKADLIVTAHGAPAYATTRRYGSVMVFYNLGSGMYPSRTWLVDRATAPAVAAGDFDKNGRLDLVVTDDSGNAVSVLLANTYGGFIAPQRLPLTIPVAGDFNGDGLQDVVGISASGSLGAALNSGGGELIVAKNSTTVANPSSGVAVDLNKDNKLDVVLATTVPNLAVHLGNGDGTFQAATSVSSGGFASAVAFADFNEDGSIDLATFVSPTAYVVLGNGDGTFGGTQVAATLGKGQGLIAVDLDGDHHVDLCNGQMFARGNGDGTFKPPVMLYSAGTLGPFGVAAADITLDGLLDTVALEQNPSGQTGTLVFDVNQGGGTFSAMTQTLLTSPPGPLLYDFNLDGRPDIALTAAASSTAFPQALVQALGPGPTLGASLILAHDPYPATLMAADFDKDGAPDLVIDSDVFLNRAQ
jgi:hypothetical protein